MPRPRYALSLLIALAIAPSVRGQTSLSPEAGLVLLTNGSVLAGHVTRAGDYYIVTHGESSEIRLPANQVEAFCGSLDEAYEFKQRHLAGRGARPHLDLADWCLRQGLHLKCSEQLTEATRAEPGNKGIAEMERRLQLAVEATPAVREHAASPAAANISAEQLENAARALPRGSVEKFGAIVQPILLNRCAANQCHGPNSKAEFRLLRPPAGQQASRRFTQRNLSAALAQLDRTNPAASPLLTMPQQRHGSALTAVFDKHSQSQLAQVESWVAMTVGAATAENSAATAPPPAAPPTIAPVSATFSQPAAVPPTASTSSETPESVRAMRPPHDRPAAPAGSTPARFSPRDRYDAEIFNRQYHK